MVTLGTDRVQNARIIRFWMYWITSILSTLLFLSLMTTMMMVPGVSSGEKVLMLSVAGAAIAVALVIGVWRFASTDAPVMTWPLGPIMGVILLCEFAECVASIVLLLRSPHFPT